MVKFVNVAFRNEDPAVIFCDPCPQVPGRAVGQSDKRLPGNDLAAWVWDGAEHLSVGGPLPITLSKK